MRCSICQSPNTSQLFSVDNPRQIGKSRLEYIKCERCKIVFLYPEPSSRDLNRIYSSQEYFTKLCQPVTNKFVQKILSLRLFPEYDQFVNSFYRRPGRLVDIGCGNGEFLHTMYIRGWNVDGVDPSRIAVKNAAKLIPEARFKTGKIYNLNLRRKYEAVTLWHVLEHEPNPKKMIRSLKRLLKTQGNIFLEVPNADSLLFRLFKNRYNWLMVPEHIYYYCPASLAYLFSQAGLRIVRFDYPPRALLNFGLSMAKIHPWLAPIALAISPLIGFVAAIAKRGEVVRVVATI